MKKILVALAAVFCCAITALAQNTQTDRNRSYTITLGGVQYTHSDEKMTSSEAVSKVMTGMLTGKTSIQATEYEEDVINAIIKGLSNSHRYRYDDSMLENADAIVAGNLVVEAVITNIQVKTENRTWKGKDGRPQITTSYKGEVEAMLTLKDVKTGEVIGNPTFSGSGTGTSYNSDSDKAMRYAIGHLSSSITTWLNKYLPLQANIIEGSTAKKDKQKEVYIDLGAREGASEGLHLAVYKVKTIAGREAKTQIGKLKIESVDGDDISHCKVQSGGKDIKAALDAGEQLVVVSTD